MKKIIVMLLTLALAVSAFAGCTGTASNVNPLVPVYANGVSPDYSGDSDVPATDSSAPSETTAPAEDTSPDGYAEYKDAYVSFVHPESIVKKIDYYLLDTDSGAFIDIAPQAVKADNYDYSRNIYAELNSENFAEVCSEYIATPEFVSDLNISKITKDKYQVTVVKYFDASEETSEPAEEGTEAVVAPRAGHAYIYVENSAQPEFAEIIISISGNEYSADAMPKGYVNFSDTVKSVVDSLKIVSAE